MMYPRIHRDVHRAVLHPFPYGIFYKNRRDTIYIIAVPHLFRDPRVWQRRS